jgi:hypothetical protein
MLSCEIARVHTRFQRDLNQRGIALLTPAYTLELTPGGRSD